jgi:serine phosphatase RsbU (regulator of sigma subunit)
LGLVTRATHQNVDEILEEVARFSYPNPAHDDCTLLEIKYLRKA